MHNSNTQPSDNKWSEKQRNFSLRFPANIPRKQYNAVLDDHNSYYFGQPGVQKHFKKLQRIFSQHNNPEAMNINRSITKFVLASPKSQHKRNSKQHKIYVDAYDRDIRRLQQNLKISKRVKTEGDAKNSPRSRSFLPPIGQYQQQVEPMEHATFLSYLNSKKMQVFMRKVYLRGSKRQTEMKIQ